MIASKPFEARLVTSRPIAPAVRELVFERADGAPFEFDPGQWVNLLLPLPGGELKRAYSIASAPIAGSPRFELAVTRVEGGPGSQYLHDSAEGAELRAIGPQGLFTRAGLEDEPTLFVATGTGVTPFRSMIEAALAAGRAAPIRLLFGVRHEEDILYRDELDRWTREHPDLRSAITLTQGPPSWPGRRGRVQAHVGEILAELRSATGAEPHAYVCGLDRMVASVRELLRNEHAVPRKHVHVERYD